MIIDKQGPSIENPKAEEYGDFLDVSATTDDPDADFVIVVGDQEFPATVDADGNITGRIPKDVEGEIKIVGTDEFGNTTEVVVARPDSEEEKLEVDGRQPFEGQKLFVAFAVKDHIVKFNIIRDGETVYASELKSHAGRATFRFDNPLQVEDVIEIQAFYDSKTSEIMTFTVEPR